MSWLFSRVLVEEYSAVTYSDGKPCAQSNKTLMPQAYWSHDKTMEPSRRSRSGMTFAHLTESRGRELLTWYREAFRAKTYQSTAKATDSTASVRVSGRKWSESFAKLDLVSFLWKTVQCSLFEDSEPYWLIWPKWGSMRSGAVCRQKTLVRYTRENEFGLLPTPRCHDAVPMHISEMKRKSPCLAALVMFPESGKGGEINPEFIESLMGWPIGWTGLDVLEMDKFQEWQQQHSISYQEGSND